tara:strand:+ start:8203 stop:8430 length:228 start_codon:yes stop_codon:yes gene_type:complete
MKDKCHRPGQGGNQIPPRKLTGIINYQQARLICVLFESQRKKGPEDRIAAASNAPMIVGKLSGCWGFTVLQGLKI